FDCVSLQALLALGDGEADLLAFLQALEALGLDGAEVNKHVLAILTADEAEALGIVEPLDGTGFTVRHNLLLGTWIESAACAALVLVARRKRGATMERIKDLQHRAARPGAPSKHSPCKVS